MTIEHITTSMISNNNNYNNEAQVLLLLLLVLLSDHQIQMNVKNYNHPQQQLTNNNKNN